MIRQRFSAAAITESAGLQTSLTAPLLLEKPDFQIDHPSVGEGVADRGVLPHVGLAALEDLDCLLSPRG